MSVRRCVSTGNGQTLPDLPPFPPFTCMESLPARVPPGGPHSFNPSIPDGPVVVYVAFAAYRFALLGLAAVMTRNGRYSGEVVSFSPGPVVSGSSAGETSDVISNLAAIRFALHAAPAAPGLVIVSASAEAADVLVEEPTCDLYDGVANQVFWELLNSEARVEVLSDHAACFYDYALRMARAEVDRALRGAAGITWARRSGGGGLWS